MSEQNQSRNLKFVFSLTLIRIPIAISFFLLLFLCERSIVMVVVAILLLLIMDMTDLLDGFLARRLKVVTELGATIDPYTDSISRLIVYSTLAYKGYALPVLPFVLACRDLTVAYSRIVLVFNRKTASAKKSGKINTGAQSVGMFLLFLGPYYTMWSEYNLMQICSYILVVITLLSVVQYVKAALSANFMAMRKPVKQDDGDTQ